MSKGTLMPFGKHKDEVVEEIPDGYLGLTTTEGAPAGCVIKIGLRTSGPAYWKRLRKSYDGESTMGNISMIREGL